MPTEFIVKNATELANAAAKTPAPAVVSGGSGTASVIPAKAILSLDYLKSLVPNMPSLPNLSMPNFSNMLPSFNATQVQKQLGDMVSQEVNHQNQMHPASCQNAGSYK